METDPMPRGRRPAGAIPFVAGGLVLLWLGAAVAAQDPAPAFPGELRKGAQEFTFLVGYGEELEVFSGSKEDREFLFFIPRWGLVLTDPVGKSFWRGGLEFVAEPSAIVTTDTPRILAGGIGALLNHSVYQVGDNRSILVCISAMVIWILFINLIFWRPLYRFSLERFRFET